MNRERLPITDAGSPAKVSVRLTRAELTELDRFYAENKLSRQSGRPKSRESASSRDDRHWPACGEESR
jgi:hypothetical protein